MIKNKEAFLRCVDEGEVFMLLSSYKIDDLYSQTVERKGPIFPDKWLEKEVETPDVVEKKMAELILYLVSGNVKKRKIENTIEKIIKDIKKSVDGDFEVGDIHIIDLDKDNEL